MPRHRDGGVVARSGGSLPVEHYDDRLAELKRVLEPLRLDHKTVRRMWNMARMANRLHMELEHANPGEAQDDVLRYLGRVIEAEANRLGVFGAYRPSRENGR